MIGVRRDRIHAAFGRERIVCLVERSRQTVRAERVLEGGSAGEIASALRDIQDRLALSSPRVEWTLLPPVSETRVIELPPLTRREVDSVLGRQAARYFPLDRGELAVGWDWVRGCSSSVRRVLLSTASGEWLEDVRRSMVELGWRPADPTPALAAWASAARTSMDFDGDTVAVALHDRFLVIHTRGTAVAEVRAVPVETPDQVTEILQEMQPATRVGVLGDEPSRGALLAALAGDGEGGAALLYPEEDAYTLAAGFSGSHPLRLLPAGLRSERARMDRRRARRLWICAAVVALWGVAAALVGTRHRVEHVRRERLAIARDVVAAVDVRARRDSLFTTLHVLDSLGSRPSWNDLLAALAAQLPRDAYLRLVQGRADSVQIQGQAADAARVIAALRALEDVEEVRARAPIQRELGSAGPVERFSLEVVRRVQGTPRFVPADVPPSPGSRDVARVGIRR